jgi:hypothetical protein
MRGSLMRSPLGSDRHEGGHDCWRGKMLTRLRKLINETDPELTEEHMPLPR